MLKAGAGRATRPPSSQSLETGKPGGEPAPALPIRSGDPGSAAFWLIPVCLKPMADTNDAGFIIECGAESVVYMGDNGRLLRILINEARAAGREFFVRGILFARSVQSTDLRTAGAWFTSLMAAADDEAREFFLRGAAFARIAAASIDPREPR